MGNLSVFPGGIPAAMACCCMVGDATNCRVPREVLERGEGGGGGDGAQKFVYQNWPSRFSQWKISMFSHDGHFGLEGGGGCTAVLIHQCVPPHPLTAQPESLTINPQQPTGNCHGDRKKLFSAGVRAEATLMQPI